MVNNIKTFLKTIPALDRIWPLLQIYKLAPAKDYYNFSKIKLFYKIWPYTMLSYERLTNAYDLAREAERKKLKGIFVECGVWKGGCIGIMADIANRANSGRKIWLFDSFEGLPKPTEKDGAEAKACADDSNTGELTPINECVGPLEEVEKLFFSVLKINKQNVVFQKGWFQDTLPKIKNTIDDIAILRIDGDWYESTKCCLENLYDRVISGGYVIIDDYGYWEGCRKAVDEFVAKRNLKIELIKIDHTGVFFKKA